MGGDIDSSFGGGSSAAGGAEDLDGANADKRALSAAVNRSISFLLHDPSGSLSGLYCAMSMLRRFLCLANSASETCTSA